ncbi:SPW repeat protein [Massilia endophytica]|uniref:SPW repeat protein n=1 Tax=Massilia endophytica TaxID=2899220 RepID=UPI001E461DBA|nr:SPW repeat protein [Massilia endophytica]UGQ47035.1 SPW repeat protein [Massilia endophytica]
MVEIRMLKRWQDELILLLGIWLFLTPWIFAYTIPSPHAWNAFVCGLAMAVLAAFDLYKRYFWAVVGTVLLGLWVALSPWVLFAGFDHIAMMWNNLIAGLAAAILAGWEIAVDPALHKWPGAGAAT